MRIRIFILVIFFPIWLISQNIYIDSLEQIIKTNNGPDKVEALKLLTEYYYQKNPDLATFYTDQIIKEAKLSENKVWESFGYNEYGRIEESKGNIDKALHWHLKALDLRKEIEDKDKQADSYEKIGRCYFEKTNYDSALFFYKKALVLNKENGNIKWASRDLTRMGQIYNSMGEYSKAISHYSSALKISEEINNLVDIAQNLNNIGSTYTNINNLQKAFEYYEQSLQTRREIGDKRGIAASLNNIGSAYSDAGNFKKALDCFTEALKLNIETGNDKWRSYNLNNIGNLYMKNGQFDLALDYYRKSLQIKTKRNDIKGIIITKGRIAEIYKRQGSLNKAQSLIKENLELSKELGLNEEIRNNYLILSEISKNKGNYNKAYEYFKNYSIIKDSLVNEKVILDIAEIEKKYLAERKARENEMLKSKLNLAGQKEQNHQIFIVLLSVFIATLLIITAFLIYTYRLRKISFLQKQQLIEKQNEQLKEKLESRNRELASNAMFLAHNNELINVIVKDVKKLNKHVNEQGRQVIHKLIRDLKASNKDNTWKEFELRFENVHSDFYKRLSEKFPDLTPNERKLCAFLRLNMTTKDVAAITFQSIRGIETARLRLRKKLRIDGDTNLVNYLSQF